MKNRIRIVLLPVALIGLILSTSCASSKIPTITTNSLSTSANGLSLSLSLDSTTYQPGQEISIKVDVKNTLSKTNKISASEKWPISGLGVGPCGTLNYPFGVAIFQGDYTVANVSSRDPTSDL